MRDLRIQTGRDGDGKIIHQYFVGEEQVYPSPDVIKGDLLKHMRNSVKYLQEHIDKTYVRCDVSM